MNPASCWRRELDGQAVERRDADVLAQVGDTFADEVHALVDVEERAPSSGC